MKYIKKIDQLGRIVIPNEIRKVLNINYNDLLDIKLENNNITINKHEFDINYEEVIRTLLIVNYGNDYIDYLITEKEIVELKDILKNYINKLK